MSDKWITVQEIAELLRCVKSTVTRRAQKERKEEKGVWHFRSSSGPGGQGFSFKLSTLPLDIQSAYAKAHDIPLDELLNELRPKLPQEPKVNIRGYAGRDAKTRKVKVLEKTPEKYLKIAALKVKVIEAYEAAKRADKKMSPKKFVELYKKGGIVPELREQLGPHGDITSFQSFYRWLQQYRKDGINGLVPQYTMREGGPGAHLPQEMKDRIDWMFLDTNQLPITKVIENMRLYGCKASDSTIRRYINAIPEAVKAKGRMGEKYFHDHFETYLIRDYTGYRSMDCICGDYMTLDLICRIKEKTFRAKLCAFMDMRSRMIVGWSLQLTANSLGVIRSLQMYVSKYGTAKDVYVDNGKEFKNYWLCGDAWKDRYTSVDPESLELDACILRELGMNIHFCLPYHAQSKPIERFWRTLHEMFDKYEITYVGSNTVTRPEEMKVFQRKVNGIKKFDIEMVPTFDAINERIGNALNYYNECHHHSGQGMGGNTPQQVFADNAEPRRDIPENMKKYIFTRREIKAITRKGICIDGMNYYSPELMQYMGPKGKGTKVEVRRDLDDVRKVSIFSLPDRVYLCDAIGDLTNSTGNTEEDIRRVNKQKKEARESLPKHNLRKAEFDKGVFKTPAELYAEETRKAVNESLPAILPSTDTQKSPQRKIISILDVD